jgi:hypothetical protein
MTKPKESPGRGQLPESGIMPKLPQQFSSFPFYYASLQCQWIYWYTSVEAAEPYVKGTGLCVARFPIKNEKGEDEDRAVIVLPCQSGSWRAKDAAVGISVWQ